MTYQFDQPIIRDFDVNSIKIEVLMNIREYEDEAIVWLIKECGGWSFSQISKVISKDARHTKYLYTKAEKLRKEDWKFRTITSKIRGFYNG